MKQGIYRIIIFLCVPVGILALAYVRRELLFEGKPAAVWFEQLQIDEHSSALNALQKLGKGAVPTLRKALHSQQFYYRRKAAWVLGRLGSPANEAIPDLIQALDDQDVIVVIYSLQSLAKMDAMIGKLEVIPKMTVKLDDPMWSMEAAAAELFCKIEQGRKSNSQPISKAEWDGIQALTHALNHGVQAMGARLLANFPLADVQVMATLKSLLTNSDGWVREQNAMYLKSNGIVVIK